MQESGNANFYQLCSQHFPADRSRHFIETPSGKCYSYDELDSRSAAMAGVLLSQGIKANDRVMVQVGKSPDAVFLYLACLRIGAVFVPLNTGYQAAELAYFLDDAQPGLVVCDPDSPLISKGLVKEDSQTAVLTMDVNGNGTLSELCNDHGPVPPAMVSQPDDTAAILYTSGTTGKPKGAMLTHGNLYSNAKTLCRAWGFSSEDVLLHALPIFHVHGLFVAINCVLMSGAKMLFMDRFDANQVLEQLPHCSVMMGVPTFYTRLLACDGFNTAACARMRLFISGSAPLLEQTWNEFRARCGHEILERYGMTETLMNTSNPLDGPRRPGTVGPALEGIKLRICDDNGAVVPTGTVGNIEMRGPNLFKGYWRKPDKTAEEFTADGFFKTGDVGFLDDDSYLTIVGRSKDLIISGGFNVYPKEIESLIDRMDGVLESAVIGAPHPDFGEGVVAIVVPDNRSSSKITPEEIGRELEKLIAPYKRPKCIIERPSLPRNVMGKVEKNSLRKEFADLFSHSK